MRTDFHDLDFERTPFIAIWEITRACDLACRHCRAEAITRALPGELSTNEGFALLEELGEMGTPICVLSGGDPAKRGDLLELVRHGTEVGLQMATIPAATPMLTRRLVRGLKDAGLAQMALSLDGPSAELHDSFRGVPGAFLRTLEGAGYAHEVGLPLQINTTFCGFNRNCFEEMAELVQRLQVVFWEVFILVPMGRGSGLEALTAAQLAELFGKLVQMTDSVDFTVKVTEAPHYRPFRLMQRPEPSPQPASNDFPSDSQQERRVTSSPKAVNSGKGHLFVSYCGDVYPSGFLPLKCGNVGRDSVAEVYRHHHVFRELRDPDLLQGKCGICEFRHLCGGSRARAFALSGDYLAEDSSCAYEPARVSAQHRQGRALKTLGRLTRASHAV